MTTNSRYGTEATQKQRSYIISLLYKVSPKVTVHTPESQWIAELNSLCNLNIESLDDLDKKQASKVIEQLIQLQ